MLCRRRVLNNVVLMLRLGSAVILERQHLICSSRMYSTRTGVQGEDKHAERPSAKKISFIRPRH